MRSAVSPRFRRRCQKSSGRKMDLVAVRRTARIFAAALVLAGTGCSSGPSPVDGAVKLDFDRKDPKPFVEFYFALFTPDGGNPLESGLVIESDGDFYLDPSKLAPEHAAQFSDAGSDGTAPGMNLSRSLTPTTTTGSTRHPRSPDYSKRPPLQTTDGSKLK